MAWMAAALPYLQAAGAVVGVGSTIAQGNQAAAQASLQADQMDLTAQQLDLQEQRTRKKAGEERAIAQRRAGQERRRAEYVKSRRRALAAASGAEGTDYADLDAAGEYRVLTALYNGEMRAQTLEQGADQTSLNALQTRAQALATRSAGRDRRDASRYKAAGTILDTAMSMYDRYGRDMEYA